MTVLAQAKCYGASHHEADQEGEHVEAVDWFVSLSPGMTELVSVDSMVKLVLDKLIRVSSSTNISRVVSTNPDILVKG